MTDAAELAGHGPGPVAAGRARLAADVGSSGSQSRGDTQPEPDQPVILTPDDYRAVGRFESALDQHAEQLYYELGSPGAEPDQQSEKQRVAERLFRSLAVRTSQGTLSVV